MFIYIHKYMYVYYVPWKCLAIHLMTTLVRFYCTSFKRSLLTFPMSDCLRQVWLYYLFSLIFHWLYASSKRHPVSGSFHIFNRPICNEPFISLAIKTKYKQRAVVRLVNTINWLSYDWTVKDEWKVTWHDPKQDVVSVSTKNIF